VSEQTELAAFIMTLNSLSPGCCHGDPVPPHSGSAPARTAVCQGIGMITIARIYISLTCGSDGSDPNTGLSLAETRIMNAMQDSGVLKDFKCPDSHLTRTPDRPGSMIIHPTDHVWSSTV
jgi:hypothetical protein